MELLVHVCHKHGALATGGMAALLLSSDEGFVSFDFLSYYSFLCVFFFPFSRSRYQCSVCANY